MPTGRARCRKSLHCGTVRDRRRYCDSWWVPFWLHGVIGAANRDALRPCRSGVDVDNKPWRLRAGRLLAWALVGFLIVFFYLRLASAGLNGSLRVREGGPGWLRLLRRYGPAICGRGGAVKSFELEEEGSVSFRVPLTWPGKRNRRQLYER